MDGPDSTGKDNVGDADSVYGKRGVAVDLGGGQVLAISCFEKVTGM
jgi:hypothetical protein